MANTIFVGPFGIVSSGGSTIFPGSVTAEVDGIATTSTDGFLAQNATISTAAVPVQQSPRIRLRSNVWNTTSVAANNTNDWWIESVPVSGTTPNGLLNFASSLNGGAATFPLTLSSTGDMVLARNLSTAQINAAGQVLSTSNVQAGGGSAIAWSSSTVLLDISNGKLNVLNSAQTSGFGLDITTDAVAKFRTRAQTGYATVDALGYKASGVSGASGTGTVITAITVVNGIITAISVS